MFDIGGTKMRLSVSRDRENIEEPIILETPQSFEEALSSFSKAVSELTQDEIIEATCGGIAGVLDQSKSMLLRSPHLPDWVNQPLNLEFSKVTGSPLFLENDASLAGLGESYKGAGVGKNIVAYITVSTGVGGARIVNGQIDSNIFGFEPGHQIISVEDFNYPLFKTLEELVSGSAIEKDYFKKPESIDDSTIWDQLSKRLSFGLHNSILHWSPDIVVIGGSVGARMNLDMIKNQLQSSLTIFPQIPDLALARLGDSGGLTGALELLKHRVSS